jgi:hypothetical protein
MSLSTLSLSTSIELNQLTNAKKLILDERKKKATIIRDYKKWKQLSKNHKIFKLINRCEVNKIQSFEEVVLKYECKNTHHALAEWEVLFMELKYKDTAFFDKFINWNNAIQCRPMADRWQTENAPYV